MRENITEQKQFAKADLEIAKTYLGADDPVPEDKLPIADLWLQTDLEGALTICEDFEKTEKEIRALLDRYPSYVKEGVNLNKAIDGALVRRNFAKAFEVHSDVGEISSILGFGFSPSDIKNLAILHSQGRYREQIEYLLTNCNFHRECSDFIQGEYDHYLSYDSNTKEI